MKLFSETLQILPHFWKKKTQIFFQSFRTEEVSRYLISRKNNYVHK